MSITGLIWLIVGICVVYDFIKAGIYIGSNKLTAYLQNKRIEDIQKYIEKKSKQQ